MTHPSGDRAANEGMGFSSRLAPRRGASSRVQHCVLVSFCVAGIPSVPVVLLVLVVVVVVVVYNRGRHNVDIWSIKEVATGGQ
jgi:hypothetical protein